MESSLSRSSGVNADRRKSHLLGIFREVLCLARPNFNSANAGNAEAVSAKCYYWSGRAVWEGSA